MSHTKTTLGHGTISPSTLDPLVSATMSSSTPSQDPNKTRSLAPFPWLSGRDDFWDQLMTPWLWAQSKIPSRIYLQPSGKMADPTQPRTTAFSLASFYNASSEPIRMPTQRKNSKKSSPPVSLPKSPSNDWRSCSVQSHNSPFLPSSLPCVRVSTSKSHNRKNDELKSFDSETFDSSKTVSSSTTMIPPSNMPTASTSHSKCRKKSIRMTQQPRHWVAWRCAQSEQLPPSFAGSDPTREQTTTLQSPLLVGTTALNISPPSKSRMHCEMPSRLLGGTHSTLQPTRLAHTQSVRDQLWQCSLGVAQFFSSWWLVAGPAMRSCATFRSKSRNSTQRVSKNAHPHVSQAQSQLHIPNSLPPQSQATQPSWQCRDTNQRRWRHGSIS